MAKSDLLGKCPDAQELASRALQTVDSVSALASQHMAFAGLILGAMALIGIGAVIAVTRWYARVEGKRCAIRAIRQAMANGEVAEFLRTCVEEAVREELSGRIFTNVQPQTSPNQSPTGGFTRDPHLRGGRT